MTAAGADGVMGLWARRFWFLVVLSAALRSPAVVGGVPQLAVSALVLPLLLYGAIATGALMPGRRLEPVPVASEAAEPAGRRRAA